MQLNRACSCHVAVVEPSEAQRKKIAQLEAGKAADMQAVADFKLRSGGGEAAVRLDKLKQLRAVVEPSEDQRETIAQLEAGEAADMQAVADMHLSKGGGEAAVRLDKLKQLRAFELLG